MPSGPLPNRGVGSIAAVGIVVLAGAAVAPLILPPDVPTDVGHRLSSSLNDHGPHSSHTSGWAGGPTFYSDMTNVNARMHERMGISPSGDIDRDFMRMMIPHHQGAIDMALVLLKHGRGEKLKRLAQSIIVEQGQEIAYMRTLLDGPHGESPDATRIADK